MQNFHTKHSKPFWLSIALLGGVALLALGVARAQGQNPVTIDAAAPELVGGPWLNTPKNQPITLASRKGKVTIVEFWTLGCINCKHNLPIYNQWNKQFAGKDVIIIGIHTPETAEERVTANVVQAIQHWGITYPILVDTQGENWRRWDQQFWPTVYLLDKRGHARYRWEGELEYAHQDGTRKMTQLIENLLREK